MGHDGQRSQSTPKGHCGRRRLLYWIFGVCVLLVAAAAVAGPIMSRVEQPEFKVEASEGAIEIRSYGAMIAAEAVVEGERKAAIGEGFQLIAAYIFGANKPNAKIAMTAPVTQQSAGNAWTVRFIMPKSWSMETLPVPNDPRISLHQIPSRRFIAVTFSGFSSSEAIEKRTAELRRYASEHGLSTTGEPMLAFYDPPWTLPFFRRNEVMLQLTS